MNKKTFIYGVPGSGKTYVSLFLQKQFGTSLLEVDLLRSVAQKNTTADKDPFLFVGTCQAYKYFGEMSEENCKKGLIAVREAMSNIVEKEIGNIDIAEGAFLNPNTLGGLGRMILVVTLDENKHREQFFQNRPENDDKINEFKSARIVQGYLIQEARELGVCIIENNYQLRQQLENILKWYT